MTRRALPAVLVLAFLFAAPAAQAARWAGTFYPGVTLPMGDFKDDSLGNANTGFQLGAALDALLGKNIAAGAEFSWGVNNNGLHGKTVDLGGGDYVRYDKDQYKILNYGLRGRYFLTTGSHFHPFALLGAGGYNVQLHQEVALGGPPLTAEVKQSGKTEFGTRFGGKVGVGFDYEGSPQVTLGLGANYNSVAMDKDKFGSSTLTFWEIRGSIGHNFH